MGDREFADRPIAVEVFRLRADRAPAGRPGERSGSVDVTQKIEDLKHYAKLERVLALICAASPLLMLFFDAFSFRDSISAYYSMKQNQIFYVPLTAAAMLFLVNGFVKQKHWYNAWLGVLLAGVILFNLQDWTWLHTVFAFAFFLGNAAVIAFYSKNVPVGIRRIFIVGVLLVLAGWAFRLYSLFWAEWISLLFIAGHYILDASDRPDRPYRAAERGEGPSLGGAITLKARTKDT